MRHTTRIDARTPDANSITSTIRVRVRDLDVPRSRVDGLDYDPASHAIVFYGLHYRPVAGDPVFVSYRAWGGSVA
jgi:hypothetical protein